MLRFRLCFECDGGSKNFMTDIIAWMKSSLRSRSRSRRTITILIDFWKKSGSFAESAGQIFRENDINPLFSGTLKAEAARLFLFPVKSLYAFVSSNFQQILAIFLQILEVNLGILKTAKGKLNLSWTRACENPADCADTCLDVMNTRNFTSLGRNLLIWDVVPLVHRA